MEAVLRIDILDIIRYLWHCRAILVLEICET